VVKEWESIDEQALQSRKVLEAVAKPLCVWSSIDFCMSWGQLQSVRQFSDERPDVGQDSLEPC
jgi:hypothetical protein